MRELWLSLVVLVIWIAPPVLGEHTQVTPPRVFQFDGGRIAEVRRRIDMGDPRLADALKRLRTRADRELQTPVLSVVEKPQTPPSGDRHDYLSLAPYYWPDPDRPQQFHLDVYVTDVDEAEPKVLALGARRLPGGGGDFRVFADPVGHPFCLVWDA